VRVVYRHRLAGLGSALAELPAGCLSVAAGQRLLAKSAVIGGRITGRAGQPKNRPSRTAYKPFSRHRRGLGLPDSQKTPP